MPCKCGCGSSVGEGLAIKRILLRGGGKRRDEVMRDGCGSGEREVVAMMTLGLGECCWVVMPWRRVRCVRE